MIFSRQQPVSRRLPARRAAFLPHAPFLRFFVPFRPYRPLPPRLPYLSRVTPHGIPCVNQTCSIYDCRHGESAARAISLQINPCYRFPLSVWFLFIAASRASSTPVLRVPLKLLRRKTTPTRRDAPREDLSARS